MLQRRASDKAEALLGALLASGSEFRDLECYG